MKSTVFWEIMLCSLLSVIQCFGETCRLRLQGRRISRARNQCESRWQAELGLFFDPEDGGDMFLWNVGWLSVDYLALHQVLILFTDTDLFFHMVDRFLSCMVQTLGKPICISVAFLPNCNRSANFTRSSQVQCYCKFLLLMVWTIDVATPNCWRIFY
jgi:hypothetical protein